MHHALYEKRRERVGRVAGPRLHRQRPSFDKLVWMFSVTRSF